MELKAKTEGRKLTLQLQGELDHHAARQLMREIDLIVEREAPRQLVLNFAAVSFMDSSGIAVVMRARRRMQELGGIAAVVDVPPQAGRVLEAAGIGRWIRVEGEVTV